MADLSAGDRFGDYRLEAPLGGGGFGDVWRASHVQTGDIVALKFLAGQYSEADTARIHAEVELLATTAARSSRHVVRVLDGGTEPVPYIVMEYIEGSDLRQELAARGSLSAGETLEVARGVLDALRVLNEAGIIHRDIKPANVMRDADGAVKLTDFGIAKIIGYDTITATGQLPLSMAYAAPEAWDGRSSHRSDLYSVGILLYQCLVGEPPFGGTYAEVYRQHLADRPDLTRLPPGAPPSLRALMARCLEKDEAARPADAAVCMQLVEAAASELEDATDPRGPRHPTRIGPWVIIDHHPTRAWAYRCQHEDTAQQAIVEVHSGDDLALGEALQRAVDVNAELAALGAERLLDTNRLVLRPGEAWPERASGRFQFWVARDEQTQRPDAAVDRSALARAARVLVALQERIDDAGLAFAPTNSDLILANGAVYLRRPGLPTGATGDDTALAALAAWPLTEEARAALEAARTLEDLAGLAPPLPGQLEPPPVSRGPMPLLWAAVGLVLLAGGLAVAAGLFVLLDGGADGDGVVASPTATASPTEVVEPTIEPTGVPALGLVVDDDFSGGAVDWTLTGSAALDDGTLVLTAPRPDERGVAWLRASIEGPFVATFDYRAGGALNSIGGQGLVFMFYKRAADAAFGSGCLGFAGGNPCAEAAPTINGSADLSGYGVEFDSHLNGFGSFPGYSGDPSAAHVALVQDSPGNHLASSDDPRVEDFEWHSVRVEVGLDGVRVEVDGEELLTWSGELDRSFGGLGFAATTTASETNWHIIDNVRVEVLDNPPPPDPGARPLPGEPLLLPRLEARSCSLGVTPRSPEYGAETWVEFANETDEAAVVLIPGGASGLTQIARLEPLERLIHRGAVGDRWIVTDARGDCRVVFEAESVAPAPSHAWLARVSAPAGTRIYRHDGLGFEFLRPRDELVKVLSGASPGLAALAIGDRIEVFLVSARGATLDEYAATALQGVAVTSERRALLDGMPAVMIEYSSSLGDADEAAIFVVRDDTALLLGFRRGDTSEGCAGDLSIYRLLLRSFRFLEDPGTSPLLLASPDLEVSAALCGAALAVPDGAEEAPGLVASVDCGPLSVGVGYAVVCLPELAVAPTVTCWAADEAATTVPGCSSGSSFLTTSFERDGLHQIEFTACTVEGCESRVVTFAVEARGLQSPPLVSSLNCAPAFPRVGATVTCEPEVERTAAQYCWSTVSAGFLDGEAERCGTSREIEGRFTEVGAAVLTLRVCSGAGLCSEAAQLLPVQTSVAALTFAPGRACAPRPVLVGEPLECDPATGGLEFVGPSIEAGTPGLSVVPITVCLPAAPLQPAVCAAHDTTVIVASSLVTGNVVDGGDALGGARVELVLVSGGEVAPLLRRALTDREGSYTLVDAPAGNYLLVFSTAVEGGGWEERARIEVTVTAEGREEVVTVDVAS